MNVEVAAEYIEIVSTSARAFRLERVSDGVESVIPEILKQLKLFYCGKHPNIPFCHLVEIGQVTFCHPPSSNRQ
jgi:hypothetical protein